MFYEKVNELAKREKNPDILNLTDAAKLCGVSTARLFALAKKDVIHRRPNGSFHRPTLLKDWAAYEASKSPSSAFQAPGKKITTKETLEEIRAEHEAMVARREKNTQSPAPEIPASNDPDDVPVHDRATASIVNFDNLSETEQIIQAIQNNIKGSEKAAYAWSRSLKEAIAARSDLIKLLDLEKKTLERSRVETWLFNMSRHNRDLWLNWPQLVCNEMAEELNIDASLLYSIMMKGVRQNLEKLATLPPAFDDGQD